MKFTFFAAAGAFLLAACVTNTAVRHELAGKSLRVELPGGEVGTVLLRTNGTTSINDEERTWTGSWRGQLGSVCVDYPKMILMTNECFSYATPLGRGTRTAFKSADGETVWVTMM